IEALPHPTRRLVAGSHAGDVASVFLEAVVAQRLDYFDRRDRSGGDDHPPGRRADGGASVTAREGHPRTPPKDSSLACTWPPRCGSFARWWPRPPIAVR